jgi:hypothetical protein
MKPPFLPPVGPHQFFQGHLGWRYATAGRGSRRQRFQEEHGGLEMIYVGYVHIYIYISPHLIYVYLTIYICMYVCNVMLCYFMSCMYVYVCMCVYGWMYGFLDDGIVYKDQWMYSK